MCGGKAQPREMQDTLSTFDLNRAQSLAMRGSLRAGHRAVNFDEITGTLH